MKRRWHLAALFTLALGATSSTIQASLLRLMSLPELVATADQIVVARVVSSSAAWDASHRKIVSTFAVDVDERWKGSGEKHLVIVQPGGTVGDIEMTVYGMPSFVQGERSLLFLQDTSRLQVVGMAQGKRPLHWDVASEQWLVGPADNSHSVELGPNAKLRHAGSRAPARLTDLRQQVMALAGAK
jgi:hypothetical protein